MRLTVNVNLERWPTVRAVNWRAEVGWRLGCNFTPSTSGNQLETWQEETFDLTTIDRELGWAAHIGMNTIRLYLHDLLFEHSSADFLARLDAVFAVADSHGIGIVPVLFDGVWHPKPRLGKQPDPVPCLHNSTWVQGPGSEIFYDRSRWPSLRPYVQEVLSRFKDDPRVIAWDLFNEPDQIDTVTLKIGSRHDKNLIATELVSGVFDWARQVETTQPLTVGIWEYNDDSQPADNPLNHLILERSDIISFHCYEPRTKLSAVIKELQAHGRPLLCTEWLARSAGSSVDLLEVFADSGVGALNWGLVDGRTQTRFPWRSWTEPVDNNEPWFHELLHADGVPYDAEEIKVFRRLADQHID